MSAYQNMMLNSGQPQSILCTGESGAGKTENCRQALRCLTYLSKKANQNHTDTVVSNGTSDVSNMTLEEQIMGANPILESFGNAKTVKNDNSSRFGRFTKLHYVGSGEIIACSLECFLLEKTRVTHQAPDERNFHIFYILCEGAPQDIKNKCYIENVANYKVLNNGAMNVRDIDSKQWFQDLMKSFEVFNIDPIAVFKVVSAVMLIPNLELKQDGKSLTIVNEDVLQKICSLLQIDQAAFNSEITAPRLCVNKQIVTKNVTLENQLVALRTTARIIYEKLFFNLVKLINNKTFERGYDASSYFICLVDIAGFEIFQKNSLEQLQINLTNEKLQQFFNHHTFREEKAILEAEGITDVNLTDHSADLIPTITMISGQDENNRKVTNSLFSAIDTASQLVKTESALLDTIRNLKNDSNKLIIPRVFSENVHFKIDHYAGVVAYNVSEWIEKNREPFRPETFELLAGSSSPLVKQMFSHSLNTVKSGILITLLNKFLQSLNNVMSQLSRTHPHFVRCIIPNLQKRAGAMDYSLVVNQLRCNGIIEGIRIVRKGYPNRMTFQVFKSNYQCLLESNKDLRHANSKEVTMQIIEKTNIAELSKIGKTMVFFKPEVVGLLEDLKSKLISHNIVVLQALAYKKSLMVQQNNFSASMNSVRMIREAVKFWYNAKSNPWYKLTALIYPTMSRLSHEIELKKKQDELTESKRKLKEAEETLLHNRELIESHKNERSQLKEQLDQYKTENEEYSMVNQEMKSKMDQMTSRIAELEDEVEMLKEEIQTLRSKMQSEQSDFKNLSEICQSAENEKVSLEHDKKKMHDELEELKGTMENLEEENSALKTKVKSLDAQVTNTASELTKAQSQLNQSKKGGDELQNDFEDLQQEADNTKKELSNLQREQAKLKNVIEQSKADNEGLVEQNEKLKASVEKNNKKNLGNEEQLQLITEEKYDLQNKLNEVSNDRDALADDLERERANLKRTKGELVTVKEEKESLSNTLVSGLADNDAMKKVESQLQQSLNQANAAKQEFEEQLEEAIRNHKNEIATLKEQASADLIVAQKESKKLKEKLGSTSDETEELQEELTRAKGQLNESTAQAKRFEARVQELNTKSSELETANANLTANLSKKSSKLSEVSSELEALTTENQQLKTKINSHVAENTSINDRIESLNDQNQKLNRRIREVQDEYEAANLTRAEIEENLAASEHKCAQLKSQLQEKSDVVAQNDAEEEARDAKLRKLTNDNDALDSELQLLKSKSSALGKEKAHLEHELDDTAAMAEQLKKELDGVKRNFKNSDNTIKACKAAEAELTTKIGSLEGELLRKDAKCSSIGAEKDELESKVNSLQGKVKNLEANLEEATSNADQSQKLSKCMKNLEALQNEKDEILDQLEDLENEVTSLKRENDVLNQNLNSQRNQHAAEMEEASEEYRMQMNNLKSKISELESEHFLSSKGSRDATKKYNEAKKLAEDAESEINSLRSTVEKLTASEKSATSQLKEKLAEHSTLNSQLDNLTKQSSDLSSKVSLYKRQAEDAENKHSRVSSELSNLRNELDEVTTSHDEIQSKFNRDHSQVKTLQAEIDSLNANIEEVSEQLKAANSSASKLKADVQKYQSGCDEAQSELEGLQQSSSSKISNLQHQLEDVENEKFKLKDRTKSDKKKIAEIENECESLRSKYSSETTRMSSKLKSVTKEVEELRTSLSSAESETSKLNSQVTKFTKDNRRLKLSLQDAETQLENKMKLLRQLQEDTD